MLNGVLVGLAIVALLAASLMFLAYRWLSASWQVVSDDELHERRVAPFLNIRGWLGSALPRITYRRDELGRFRRYRR